MAASIDPPAPPLPPLWSVEPDGAGASRVRDDDGRVIVALPCPAARAACLLDHLCDDHLATLHALIAYADGAATARFIALMLRLHPGLEDDYVAH